MFIILNLGDICSMDDNEYQLKNIKNIKGGQIYAYRRL